MADTKPTPPSSTVESVTAYANRLSTLLANSYSSRGASTTGAEYLHVGTLQQLVQQALIPAVDGNADFPRWMYDTSDGSRMVNNAEEEAALGEGWSRTAPLQTYVPQWFTEKPTSLGGTKVYDLRSVLLRTPAEEEQFRANVELEDWVADPERAWGGRGIPLAEIVAERTALLHQMLDDDLAAGSAAAAPAPEDADADAPATSAHVDGVAAPVDAEEEK